MRIDRSYLFRFLAVLLLLTFVIEPGFRIKAQPVPARRSNAPPEVVDFFRTNAIPLRTTDPDSDLADMEPLRSLVSSARIVAMGEATHGTREFFRMKHRMLRFLVERMGFTVFAIEANWPESLAVNDYVLNGKGDPAAALAGMYFWTENTEEVLDMIRWMREYNQDHAHREKLKFYGFDMQYARVAAQNVESYLETVDPAESKAAGEILAPLVDQANEDQYSKRPQDEREQTAEGTKRLLADFEARKAIYAASSSRSEWIGAEHNLEIVREAEELHSSHHGSGLRDNYMAENVQWILDHEPRGTRMMLWAHDGHVSTTLGSMGRRLRQLYGRDFLSCGLSFYQGAFQARLAPTMALRSVLVGPSPPSTLDAALADTGIPLFAIDLRTPPSSRAAREWLNEPHKIRAIGAVYDESFANKYFLPISSDSFDVIFFIKTSTAARENRALPKPMDIDLGRG